jgi:ATP-dependent protease ClpP protease subunit
LYDEIGSWGITAADFMAELADIDTAEIVVHISSQGGHLFDGIAIYNALRTHSSPVTTKVYALAASIASVIVQAGDRRMMVTGSQMMIHEAHGLGMRDYADLLVKLTDTIAGIYAERTGGKKNHFMSLMKDETWMSPVEALKEGLIDDITRPEETRETKADWAGFLESCEVGGSPNPFDKTRFLESVEIR